MATWNFQRFLQTICYFGIVPVIGDTGWMQELLGTQAKSPIPSMATASTPPRTITVLGSASPLRDSMVAAFDTAIDTAIARARPPQSNPSDQLGNSRVTVQTLERSPDDDTLRKTDILACCPHAADNWTVKSVADRLSRFKTSDRLVLFDFRQPHPELAETWGAVDDVVMGGVSASEFRLVPNGGLFTGTVSTDNNGGFVSVRTRNFETPLNLGDCTGIELRVKGDGQRYKILVRDDARWDGVGYAASFDTTFNFWQTVRIPFSDFRPVRRARTLENYPPLDTGRVRSLQLMLSKFEYDGELNPKFTPGPFNLTIETLGAYGACGRSPKLALIGGSPAQNNAVQSSGMTHFIFATPITAVEAQAIAQTLLKTN